MTNQQEALEEAKQWIEVCDRYHDVKKEKCEYRRCRVSRTLLEIAAERDTLKHEFKMLQSGAARLSQENEKLRDAIAFARNRSGLWEKTDEELLAIVEADLGSDKLSRLEARIQLVLRKALTALEAAEGDQR